MAGGLSILTSPDLFSGLSRGQFLSKTGSCKTFDNAADGYCRADGIGTVVIKRLQDAESDRDNVLAAILGAGTNHSSHAISITHPHAGTQSDLYRQVLQQAGVDPNDVAYIEMHGTGTQAGDGTEMKSVSDVFAPPAPKSRPRDSPLYVGAIKSNVGHGEASSGVVSLIKAMTILKKSLIPPHAGIKGHMNVGFPDLKERNIHIASRMTPFPEKHGVKKTILVNNFSAAGGNTALLIQEPPETQVEQNKEPRNTHPVTVSGHSHSAMLNNLDRLIAFLANNMDVSPLDLSYTTTARRRHYSFRATVVESSTPRIIEALKLKRESVSEGVQSTKKSRSVVFTFTGQGSAYPALARDIYNTSTQFRADICHFDGIARQQGFPTFLPMITDTSLSDPNVLSPAQTQIGLVCIQVALARLWSSFGIKPSAVIGHSLGEYAALQVAGVISVSDMILLVGSRARLMESKCERNFHAMLAVAAPGSTVVQSVTSEFLDGIDLACSNTPRDSVFAGERSKIEQLAHKLEQVQIRSTQLRVPYAFHSTQVDSILEDFGNIANVVKMGKPRTTFISPTRGRVLDADDQIDAEYLKQHCRQTVQFAQAIEDGRKAGIVTEMTTLIEIGPHPICSAMVRSTLGASTQTLSTLNRKENPWHAMVCSLASLHDTGMDVNWSEYQRDFESACRLIHLPSYAFDNKNYWIDYRNDWTLRKGDPLPTGGAQASTTDKSYDKKTYISSSVHRVVEEINNDNDQPRSVFETDLSYADIHTAMSGHRVNGSALCPSSLYADMALTIAKYISDQPDSGLDQDGQDVCDMEVTQPLIINPRREEENRTLRVSALIDKVNRVLSLEYSSSGPTQEKSVKHAVCRVEFGESQKWSKRWAHDLHLVKDRITSLKVATNTGKASNITKQLTYRLFANLVDYGSDFQRMRQVWLDTPGLEAAAVIALDKRKTDADFTFSPYHLDGLLHLSGFIMNGNDAVDANEAVYISHGWQSLRLAEPLVSNGNYEVYVKMLPIDKTMVAGNVYILHDEKIVGLCEGIRFQRVPRAVLDMLLPPVPGSTYRPPGESGRPVSKNAKPTKSIVATASKRPVEASRQKQRPSVPAEQYTSLSATAAPQSEHLMQVIANEVGLGRDELKVTDSLVALGVDSLMSLALAGQLSEHFGVTVDHAELMQCHSIKDLLDLLSDEPLESASLQDSAQTQEQQNSSSSSTSSQSSVSPPASSGTVTPPSRAPTPAAVRPVDGIRRLVYSIMVEETGIEEDDLQPSTDLSNLGIDSLMNLAILAKLREAGIDLGPTFFLDNRTLNEVYHALGKGEEDPEAEGDHIIDSTVPQTSEFTSKVSVAAAPVPYAQCILLQKAALPSTGQSLFLLPDGSGSPSAYGALERLDPTLHVFGLVCPFLKTPSTFTEYGLERTAALYINSLLAKCPSGQIHLGGWSVGGVLAFEAAKQLIQIHDRQVGSLILIDAPCPLTLPPMNKRLIQFLDSRQLFAAPPPTDGERHGPSRPSTEKHRTTLEHFDATVDILGRYRPAPVSAAIRTCIIWARDGVLEHGDVVPDTSLLDDPIAKWILQDRKYPDPHGWDQLLPTSKLDVITTPGNHFSMMVGDNVKAVSLSLRAHFQLLSVDKGGKY